MKSFFADKNLKTIIVTVILTACGVLSYFGYNEYVYNEIGECILNEDFQLAETKLESISGTYKDIDKVKMLLHTINNFDENKIEDYERTIAQLEGFKGFKNTSINYYYNSFYRYVISINTDYTAKQNISTQITTETYPPITQQIVTTTAVTISQSESQVATETTAYASENEYNTTTEAHIETTEQTTTSYSQSEIVYYVESGEVYHVNPSCRTLAKSTNVYSGPISEGRRACKVCS